MALRIRDSGINVKMKDDIYWTLSESERADARKANDKNKAKLSMSHFYWAWILNAVGVGMSALAFIVEITNGNYQSQTSFYAHVNAWF